ncbi:MAG: hypothetical protein ACPG4U_06100 [Pseudomonadales bacterium]
MSRCCAQCQRLLETGHPHQHLSLLSAVTQSELFKCAQCNTYIHHVLGQWEVFMFSAAQAPQIKPEHKNTTPSLERLYSVGS